jgi:hypothetical protein
MHCCEETIRQANKIRLTLVKSLDSGASVLKLLNNGVAFHWVIAWKYNLPPFSEENFHELSVELMMEHLPNIIILTLLKNQLV